MKINTRVKGKNVSTTTPATVTLTGITDIEKYIHSKINRFISNKDAIRDKYFTLYRTANYFSQLLEKDITVKKHHLYSNKKYYLCGL
ncbi:MAG: hypothetical protein LBE13_04840 [Bacteroidales bacterium]|nr:hypothetical protein [Bacteroidales bacterium]